MTTTAEPVAPTLADMLRPVPGKIAVLVETKDQITPQGLLIPYDTAKSLHEQRATQGKVIAVGVASIDEDSDLDPPSLVSVGDHVIFGKYTGTSITYQPDRTKPKQEVIVMEEKSVLAVLLSPEQAKALRVKG